MYQRPSNGRFGYSSAPASSRGSEPLPVVEGEEDVQMAILEAEFAELFTDDVIDFMHENTSPPSNWQEEEGEDASDGTS